VFSGPVFCGLCLHVPKLLSLRRASGTAVQRQRTKVSMEGDYSYTMCILAEFLFTELAAIIAGWLLFLFISC
jgi:hypothetical protein